MFQNDDNYRFFVQQYDFYLSAIVDTYAYCLLGNHFHLLIRVKEDLTTFQKLSNLKELGPHQMVSHQFRKFFQSYAMAFNKQQNRTGTLFQTPFKRAWVDTDQYFTQLVYYIHANPQLHGLTDDFREWKWSSYDRILIDKPSKLKKQEVIDWFGNVNEYKEFHSLGQKIICDDKYILED
jgi:REP element-mobilizing transposase RayT